MKKCLLIAACACCIFITSNLKAATITAVNNGPWTTNSTWSCNCQPTSSDNIVIPAGRTVTMNGPVILFLGPVITITIGGTLALTGGASLIVDNSDIINILAGGKITSAGALNSVWSGVTPINIPNGSQITGPSHISGGVLPVTLLFFKGTVEGRTVLLEWASASEEGFDYYDVERSNDGLHFESLGHVVGAGFSTVRHEYEFVDRDALEGISYYRLTAVDMDGTAESFEIVRIELEEQPNKHVDVYPNPVIGGEVMAKLNFIPAQGRILIYNSMGGVVTEKPLAGDREYQFELSLGVPSGIYYVVVRTDKGEWRSRLVVE